MPLEVEKCCCCVDLRIGCLIIGYFNLIWHLSDAVKGIVYVILAARIADDAVDKDKDKDKDNAVPMSILMAILAIELLLAVVNVIFNILMLIGIHQDVPGFVKAYLIYAAIFVVLAIVLFGINIFLNPKVYEIVGDCIDLLLTLYFLIVIRSYYMQM